jgi:hypothetical protein
MAYEVLLDQPTISGVVGLDVSTQDPEVMNSVKTQAANNSDVSTRKPAGMETVEHMALIVALTLGVLWFFGTTLLKDARL